MHVLTCVFLVRGFVAILDFSVGPRTLQKKIKNHRARERDGKTSLKCSERARPSKDQDARLGGEGEESMGQRGRHSWAGRGRMGRASLI